MQRKDNSALQSTSSDILTLETTICHIIRGNELLLIQAARGIGRGKWNAPGGKIDPGETPEQCAIREVGEETGLKVTDLVLHGELWFYKDGQTEAWIHTYLFSTKKFSGTPHSTEEGEVRWADSSAVDYNQMWPDDIVWWHLMLDGRKFDGKFYFDEQASKLLTCEITFKE